MKRTKQLTPEPLTEVLATLQNADPEELLAHWAKLYAAPPPKISTVMLRQAVAYQMQEREHGKLKPAVRSYLEKEAAGKAAIAPTLARPGTRLVRQWRGTTYEVIILPDGVLLDGVHLSSLTKAAYKITGAKWSGPRFFGLVKGGRNGGSKTA
jgi:hypothetical protein